MSLAQVREELAKLSSLVLTARRLLGSGAQLDLSAMTERVSSLTALLEALPRTEAQPLLPEVEAVLRRLDLLGGDLEEQLARVTQVLDEPVSGSGGAFASLTQSVAIATAAGSSVAAAAGSPSASTPPASAVPPSAPTTPPRSAPPPPPPPVRKPGHGR